MVWMLDLGQQSSILFANNTLILKTNDPDAMSHLFLSQLA